MPQNKPGTEHQVRHLQDLKYLAVILHNVSSPPVDAVLRLGTQPKEPDDPLPHSPLSPPPSNTPSPCTPSMVPSASATSQIPAFAFPICPLTSTQHIHATSTHPLRLTASPRRHPFPQKHPVSASSRPHPDVVVVPGKFDSFHLGHRRLAHEAAQLGTPTLVSFSGMSSALGWAPRPPVVADVERDRVLRSWSVDIGVPLSWRVVAFDQVRNMTPDQFLSFIVEHFGAVGIVCGADWRFGKHRTGNVDLLQRISHRFDLQTKVLDAVDIDGTVSSTRIRTALQNGEVDLASKLLGRCHRLVGSALYADDRGVLCGEFVNMTPADGMYNAVVRVIGRADPFQAQVLVFTELDERLVRVSNSEQVFCTDCEVHIDFVSAAQ